MHYLPDAETQFDMQYHATEQAYLDNQQCNADGILRDVAALETVLESMQSDVACFLETRLLPKDKSPEIPQCGKFPCDRQFQGENRGGGLVVFVLATLVISAIHPTAGACSALEKLEVAIQLPS